jgi:phosphate transport system protein
MRKFELELDSLKSRVLEMGEVAERMVARASEALVQRDRKIVADVLAAEETLDRFQVEIDGEAVRLITVYTPTAKDLRFLLMVVRINTEIERIGDQAVNNCEYVEMFLSNPPARPLHDLSRMTDIACEMVHGALGALASEDVEMARHVVALDDQVDALNQQTFTDLLVDCADTDAETIKRSMSLILLARSLERIADHAVNICEEVVFLVKGEDIRHQA